MTIASEYVTHFSGGHEPTLRYQVHVFMPPLLLRCHVLTTIASYLALAGATLIRAKHDAWL